ncbi:MAG TPA: lytic transglycosylase domain-containing protein [Bacilli bacterium]
MNFLGSKKVLAVLLLLFLVLLFYNTNWAGKWIYPIKYRDQIELSAVNYNLDPYLISSIIRVESNYKPELVSRKGAVGLMQIMPDTAEWIIDQGGYANLNLESLQTPEVNIDIGAWYLQSLTVQHERYLSDESKLDQLAILAAAYNAGPGNLKKWLNSGEWNGKYKSIGQIPFGETRHYIQRVIYYYKKYVKYYGL